MEEARVKSGIHFPPVNKSWDYGSGYARRLSRETRGSLFGIRSGVRLTPRPSCPKSSSYRPYVDGLQERGSSQLGHRSMAITIPISRPRIRISKHAERLSSSQSSDSGDEKFIAGSSLLGVSKLASVAGNGFGDSAECRAKNPAFTHFKHSYGTVPQRRIHP